MLGIFLNDLYGLSHLLLTTVHQLIYYYSPFTRQYEISSERLNKVPNIHQISKWQIKN